MPPSPLPVPSHTRLLLVSCPGLGPPRLAAEEIYGWKSPERTIACLVLERGFKSATNVASMRITGARPFSAISRAMSSPRASTSARKFISQTGASQEDQYTKGSLEEFQLDRDPLYQFQEWFSHARNNGVFQPETVTLATASLPSGRVSSRMVYMKELDPRGFVLYSNWGSSKKAADINSNPHASLTFWWRELERQVRVEGKIERMSSEESQPYYDTRGRGSRIGAWASRQSQVLKNRGELEAQVQEVEKRFEGQQKIPVPDFWGGVRIVPDMIEFWQGRESRLHDRFKYTKEETAGGGWRVERLSP